MASTQSRAGQSNSHPTSSSPSPSPTSALPALPIPSFYVQALYAYSGIDTSSLSFRQGDIIEVLSTLASGWWDGVICEQKVRGWFPSNYVQKISEEEAAWAREQMVDWWNGDEGGEQGVDGAEAYGDEVDGSSLSEFMVGGDGNDFSSGGDAFNELAATVAAQASSGPLHGEVGREGRDRDSTYRATPQGEGDEDLWVPKVTKGGRLFYCNTRTGETSEDMPVDGQGDGVVIDPSEWAVGEDNTRARDSVFAVGSEPAWRGAASEHQRTQSSNSSTLTKTDALSFPRATSTAEASIASGWTERGTARLRGMSLNSDDSALDADFGLEERRGVAGRTNGDKNASTSELLAPIPPPLLSELETHINTTIDALVLTATRPGLRPNEDRERLAYEGDTVVTAVRTLLHTAGVLDHTSPSLSPLVTTSLTGTPMKGPAPTISRATQSELRPFTHRVTSSLSKLVLSVRGVWALLETSPLGDIVDLDDGSIADATEMMRRASLRQSLIQTWEEEREKRVDRENKLRIEVEAGARMVQAHVRAFLGELERVILGGERGEAAMEALRMPKPLQGSLRTNAAALLLPGGGFGGNWRGNGFVTLPTSYSTPALPSNSEREETNDLAYVYPSKPISARVASVLRQESTHVIDEADALQSLLQSVSSSTFPLPPGVQHQRTGSIASSYRSDSSASQTRSKPSTHLLITQSAKLQQRIARFLAQVEDIDVATGIETDAASEGGFVSRSDSRKDDGEKRDESDVESILDPSSMDKNSAQEVRRLLVELEISKQAVYDIAPALLSSLQEQSYRSNDYAETTGPAGGAQPIASSPLAFATSPPRTEEGSAVVLGVLSDLTSAVKTLCTAFDALGTIADVQASESLESRDVVPLSASISSLVGASNGDSRNLASRQSSRSADEGESSRTSIDSDYFFPASSVSNTTSRSKISAKVSQLFSPTSSNGEERRGSNATTSSAQSDGLPYRREFPSRLVTEVDSATGALSPGRKSTTSSKLAKLLGDDPTKGNLRFSLSQVEPTPHWLSSDYGPDEVSFNMEGQIKGGTLRALIVAAASHEGRVDSNYLSAFLMTYRTFCTAHVLLDLLIDRFLVQPPPGLTADQMASWESKKQRPIRARVANVIKSWVREHMDHDEYDPELLHRISDFAALTMRDPVQSPQIMKAVEERLSRTAPRPVGNLANSALPSSIVPRSWKKIKFTEVDPLELARQLTLMDGLRFSKITPQECLGKAWPKKYGPDAPNISKMIDMSNAVTHWVMETILGQEDLKKRANIVKHFIAVAEKCYSLNNFSTLIHIIAGLNSTPVHRLRRTWEAVSQKAMATLSTLNMLMKSDKNYREYREALRVVAPPCVPFLGVYLTDWTFIGDGNPDMLRDKPHQINFQKRQKASDLILMIKLHQSTIYNLAKVPQLEAYLDQCLYTPTLGPEAEDQRLYEISLSREPRERDDERVARLLSESGFL